MLSIMVGEDEIPMGAVTDNECFGELLDALYGGMVPVFVVEDEELEVYRRGRTMYAALTTGVGFIHPVSAEFKVCSGKPEKGMESMPGMTMTYISYEAVVHFVYDGDAYTSTGLVVPQFLLKMTPL